jgi:hypothetical protein
LKIRNIANYLTRFYPQKSRPANEQPADPSTKASSISLLPGMNAIKANGSGLAIILGSQRQGRFSTSTFFIIQRFKM